MATLAELVGLTPPKTTAPDLRTYLRERANFHGVNPDLAESVFRQESSSGRNAATSTAGARGPMQLLPATFGQMYPEGNIDDPLHNIEAGVRYLKHGKQTLGTDDPRLLAAGYYQGYNRDSLKRGEIVDTNPDPRQPSVPQYAEQVAGRVRGNTLADIVGLDRSRNFLTPRRQGGKEAPKETPQSRNAFAYANDFMINTANALAGLAKAGADAVAPGGTVSDAIDQFIKSGTASQSDWQKLSDARLADALKDSASEWDKPLIYLRHAIVDDPLKLLAEGAGNIGPFALLGRSLQAARVAEPLAEKIVMGVAATLGAGEVRGNIYERIQQIPDEDLRRDSPDYATLRQTMTEKQAKHELGSRFVEHLPELAVTALVSSLGGKYGLEGLAARVGPKGVGRLGAAALGTADEASQGAVEQLASNVGVRRVKPDQSLVEDVGLNAAMEGLLGGVGGAVAGSPARPSGAPPGPAPAAGSGRLPEAPGPLAGGIPDNAEAALGNAPQQAATPATVATPSDPLGRVPLPEGFPAVARSNRALPPGEIPEGAVGASDVPEIPPVRPAAPPQWEDDGRRYTVVPIDNDLFERYIKPDSLAGLNTWEEYHARYPAITHMRLQTKDGREWKPARAPFIGDEQMLMRTVPPEALTTAAAPDVNAIAADAPQSAVTPDQVPEPAAAPPEAESQAPAPEAGDAGVAPGQGAAAPDLTAEQPLPNRSSPLDNSESPKTTVDPRHVDVKGIASRHTTKDGALDIRAASAEIVSEVERALDAGKTVTLFADGRPRQIVSIVNGMLTDEKGQQWGSMLLLTDKNGGNRIEIDEAPESQDAESDKRDTGGAAPSSTPRRGKVGEMLSSGEVVLTASGRATTPFPKVSMGTDRKTMNTVRAVDRWLLENAAAEARSRGDDTNARVFEADAGAKSISPASKDSAEEYLFGEQPPVLPSILKPLVPDSKSDLAQKTPDLTTGGENSEKPAEAKPASTDPTPSGHVYFKVGNVSGTPGELIMGKKVSLKSTEGTGLQFAVHPTLVPEKDGGGFDKNRWTVTELSTGFSVTAGVEGGEQVAVDVADQRLAKVGQARLLEVVGREAVINPEFAPPKAKEPEKDPNKERKAEAARHQKILDEAPIGSTLKYDGKVWEKRTTSLWGHKGTTAGPQRASSFFASNGMSDYTAPTDETTQESNTSAAQETKKVERRKLENELFTLLKGNTPLMEAARNGKSAFEIEARKIASAWMKEQAAEARKIGNEYRAYAAEFMGELTPDWFDSLFKEVERLIPKSRPAKKLENTGDDLRRWWEANQAAKPAKAEIISQIDKATVRAELLAPEWGENPTPGLIRWFEELRNGIQGFRNYLSSRLGGYRETSDETIVRVAEYELETLVKMAEAYGVKLRDISDALSGARTVQEAAEKFKQWRESMPFDGRVDFQRWTTRKFYAPSYYPDGFRTEGFIKKENEANKDTVPLKRPRLSTIERTGMSDSPRGDKDATPEGMKQTFGFADIGFGKWVPAGRDQTHLNYSFDAFHDLATFIKAPLTAIGLPSADGALHFTIGALGHGKYAAHYADEQPGPDGGTVRVINVTNTRGDGTVAHEWGHALDYALRRTASGNAVMNAIIRQLKVRYDLDRLRERAIAGLRGDVYMSGKARGRRGTDDQRIKNAENVLHYYMNHPERVGGLTSFKREADRLGKDYWGNDRELFARAWEAWVYDNIEGDSPYLVTDFVAEGHITRAAGYRGTPYPAEEERRMFAGMFETLRDAIEWTDRGPTIKDFSKASAALDSGLRWQNEVQKVIDDLPQMLEQMKLEEDAEKNPPPPASQAEMQTEVTPPPATDTDPDPVSNGPMSDDELSALFDQAAAQLKEELQEQPDAPDPGETKKPARKAGTKKSPPKKAEEPAAPESPAAADLISEAAKLGVTGINEALSGLAALFGGNKLKSFPSGFDPETYAKAKPHFEASLKAFQQAGKTLLDLFKLLIQNFGEGVKPYAIQFAKEKGLGAALSGEKQVSAEMTIAEKVAKWLAQQTPALPITESQLFAWAKEAWGGTIAEGKFEAKDAYDAAELGMNLYIRDRLLAGVLDHPYQTATTLVDMLAGLVKRLPTQTRRSDEMIRFQQFSTPPQYAYVANWVANLSTEDVYLEPSAGTGSMAIWGYLAGSLVWTNELAQRRAAILREVFGARAVTTENADHLSSIFASRQMRPTVVVMNPPFSATAGRTDKKDLMTGARHIEEALKLLQPGGRLVAIVGRGMSLDSPTYREWWNKIRAEYDVRANIGVGGKDYAKYGTSFETRLLVIDKTGPTTRDIVGGEVESVAELPPKLEGIRVDRQKPAGRGAGAGEGAGESGGAATASGDVEQPGQSAGPGSGDVGAGAGAGGPGGARPGSGGSGRSGRKGSGGGNADSGRPGAAASSEAGQDAAGGSDSGARSGGNAGGGQKSSVTLGEAEDQKSGAMTDAVFEVYTPQRLKIDGSQPHPGELVQSAAMSALLPPKPTYTPNLPKNVIAMKDGIGLSDAQLEAVVYAGQTFQEIMPDGMRRGFFIGDGTGVGKGREIAGIILDHQRQGIKKHVWVSEKSGLLRDAKRDTANVGGNPDSVFKMPSDANARISEKDGVIFTTYATLRSGFVAPMHTHGNATPGTTKIAGKRSRLDQLKEWLGEDFDGVIAMDEAHNMRGAIDVKEGRGTKNASLTGLAGVELQKSFPKARIVYVSATGATEVSNLSYATRLGLWGEGTPFPNVREFTSKIGAAGLSAMEIVAQSMKAAGSYISRSLSYIGIKYSRMEHKLSPLQREMYDEMARAWQIVLENIDAALHSTGQAMNGQAKGKAMSQFYGSQLRFFNQIITAMQMPSVLDAVRADLDAGHAVVLQLVNTNEAAQKREVEKQKQAKRDAGDLSEVIEDLDLTPRQILIDFLSRSFPTQKYEQYVDEEGNTRSRPVVDSQGRPVEDPDAVARRDQMLKNLEVIRMPDNPIDLVLSQFGDDRVAEITGRSRRFVRKVNNEGEIKLEEQARTDKSREADADAFQNDERQVLIFSDAGGTGFSFQADRTKKNQRMRRHYLVQAGWRADKAVQGFGRTHRTNQKQAPEYILPLTDIPGHKRFISSIARRLDQLGALTKGQREAKGSELFDATDNLESKYAESAVQGLLLDMYMGVVPNGPAYLKAMGFWDKLEDAMSGDEKKWPPSKPIETTQFINRVLMLTLGAQEDVFSEFMNRLEQGIALAQQQGTYDEGLQTLKAQSTKIVREKVVYSEPKSGAETRYVELQLTQPTKFNDMEATIRVAGGAKDFLGWYQNNRSKRLYAVFKRSTTTAADGTVTQTVAMMGPSSSRYTAMPHFDRAIQNPKTKEIVADWNKIKSDEEARKAWLDEVDRTPKTYTETKHMVYGAIMPVWDRLPQWVKVARVQTDEGKRILGRLIDEKDLEVTLERLGVGSKVSEMKPEELFAELGKGNQLALANGWVIKPVTSARETRYEISAVSYFTSVAENELVRQGAMVETHNWSRHVYIPNDDIGPFKRIIAAKPVIRIGDKSQSKRTIADGGDETSFSRSRRPRAPTRVKDVDAAIAPIRRAGRGLPPVVTVQHQSQLPEDLQMAIEADGSVVRGAFHNGSIYLIGDNLTSPADAVFTLLHEAAHYGLEGVFGRELNAVLMKMYQDNAAVRDAVAKLRSMHPQLSTAKATEEVLADMAGRGERPTFLQKFIAWIRDWFRRRGVNLKMTDGDVLAIIARAQGYWQRPTKWTHLYHTSFSQQAPVFYSQLAVVVGSKGSTATATEWKQRLAAWINGGQVKRDEVEWSGVREWLDLQQGRVTTEQVLGFLRENGVRVEEVRLGAEIPMSALPRGWTVEQEGDDDDGTPNFIVVDEEGELMGAGTTAQEAMRDAADPDMLADMGVEAGLAKYAQYTLPGGTHYREVLLTLPSDTPATDHGTAYYRETTNDFRSPHWDAPNILAHIRVNDRADDKGRRVLFVEEIQSDWGQKGRKEGFITKETRARDDARLAEIEPLLESLDAEIGANVNAYVERRISHEAFKTEARRLHDLARPMKDERLAILDRRRGGEYQGGAVAAPFVTKTESWTALALKRVIRMAAEEGYDAVALVNGDQASKRYGLGHHIDTLRVVGPTKYGPDFAIIGIKNGQKVMDRTAVPEKDLSNYVGKDLAERIVTDFASDKSVAIRNYAGVDLTVGGQGMRAFYDQIVPAVTKDVLKKVGGGRMQTIDIVRPNASRRDEILAEIEAEDGQPRARTPSMTQPGFLITDEMREKAMQGLPMFSRDPSGWGEVEGGGGAAQNGAVPTEVISDDKAQSVLDYVASRIAQQNLGELPAGAVRPVAPRLDRLRDADAGRVSASDIQGAERIAETFGHAVVWFENTRPEIVDFGGFVSARDSGRIYINVNSRRPYMFVVGHELLHRMRLERPDLYDAFLAAVRPLLRNTSEHWHPFVSDPDKQTEELLADFAGWNMMRRGFWRDLAAQNGSAFRRIADYVLSFLDRLVMKLGRTVGDQSRYFSDVVAAQRALTEAMAQWRPGGTVTQQEALSFATNSAPPTEGRFVSGYKAQATKVLDRMRMEFDPFAFLPNRKTLEAIRYRLLGRIASFDEIANDIKSIFQHADEAVQQAAYRFFLDPDGDPGSIPDPAVAAMAERAKRLIESVGDALVARGVLSPEAREAHRGRYLPQVYLKFLLGNDNWKALGGGKKISNQGYLKGRTFDRRIGPDGEVHVYDAATGEPVDEEFLDAVMGPVRDPGFLASMAIVRPLRDMAILDYLDTIAGNTDWVLGGSVIEWRGKRVSAHWAKMEADRLRKQSRHQDEPDASNAKKIADELDRLADEALGEIAGEHRDYRQIPDTVRYGRLRGIWVRKEIYDDLMGVNDFIPADPGWAMSLLGYGGIGSKITALWKAGKVSLNPPAQVRNFISNMVLLQLSGVPLHRIPTLFIRSVRQIMAYNEARKGAGQLTPEQRAKSRHYLVALRYGVTESTFNAQELFRMQRDVLALESRWHGVSGTERARHVWSKIKLAAAAVLDWASDKYQFTEALGKTMKIMDEMDRNGTSEADAALAAQEALFDYSLVSKNVRYLRNAPLGMPFVTFAVKVAPALLKTARHHPERFAPWIALAYGLPALVAAMLDVSDDDLEKLKKALPEWLRDRGHAYILPIKDEAGRWQAVDLGYFFPWTTWTEPFRMLADGEPGKTVQALGMFSGPLADIIVAMMTGRDSFTGREIVQAGDPPQRQYLQMVNYMWSMAMPPIVTEFGSAGKAIRAYAGETNRFGDPLATGWQAAWSAVGVNIHAIHPETSRMQEAKRMLREIGDVKWRLRQQLSDRSLSEDKKASLMTEYQAEMRRRQEKLVEYLQDSEIHPNLRTGPMEEVTP